MDEHERQWYRADERMPEADGYYRVRRRQRGAVIWEDLCEWRRDEITGRGQWYNRQGKAIKSVEMWREN